MFQDNYIRFGFVDMLGRPDIRIGIILVDFEFYFGGIINLIIRPYKRNNFCFGTRIYKINGGSQILCICGYPAFSWNIGGNIYCIYAFVSVSYTHLRAHETDSYLVCRLLLEKKKK